MYKQLSVAVLVVLTALMGLAWSLEFPGSPGLVPLAEANPGVRYVATDGDDQRDCNTPANRCRSVQRAVDVAVAGDEIRVASGVYTDVSVRPRRDNTTTGVVTQLVYISKTVAIYGGYTTLDWTTRNPTANAAMLDAQGRGRVFYVTGNVSPTLTGLRITGGDAAGQGGDLYTPSASNGGAGYVISAQVTLRDNQIFGNSAPSSGGGLYVLRASLLFSGNMVVSNTAGGGGGMYSIFTEGTLGGNIVMSNTATTGNGGGLYFVGGEPSLRGNIISHNVAQLKAGGVQIASSSLTLENNLIVSNSAGRGGAVDFWYSSAILRNNFIGDNVATLRGSALLVEGSQPALLHNTLAHNSGGDGSAVYVTDDGNGVNSAVVLSNTIIVSHTTGVTTTAGSSALLQGVLWHGNVVNYPGGRLITVTSAVTGDPAFAADGYHLTAGSRAINAGVNAAVTSDIDGDVRPVGPPDIGADEWALKTFLPFITRSW